MLADLVEGFYSGITSGLGRIFSGLFGILVALIVCELCSQNNVEWLDLSTWLPDALLVIFYQSGVMLLLRFPAFVLMWASYWAYCQERQSRIMYFVMFSCATFYFSALCHDKSEIAWLVGSYLVLAILYWTAAPVLDWIWQKTRTQEAE